MNKVICTLVLATCILFLNSCASIISQSSIGMLIVDPVMGAMYKLDDEYMNVNLSSSSSKIDTPSLKVYDLANTPKEWQEHLVEIEP